MTPGIRPYARCQAFLPPQVPLLPILTAALSVKDVAVSLNLTDCEELAKLLALAPESAFLAPLRIPIMEILRPPVFGFYKGVINILNEMKTKEGLSRHAPVIERLGLITESQLLDWHSVFLRTLHTGTGETGLEKPPPGGGFCSF